MILRVIQMKSKDYWKKRSEQVARKQYKKVDKYINSMKLEYEIAKDSIQKDIESFYARFAANNEITLDEARKLLNSNELREFKMGLKEFTNKAKNNIDDKWEQELNNVSYKVRISRLQALQTQINNEIGLLYSKQQNDVTSLLSDVYEDTYYRNIYEVHKGLGIGIKFAKLDTNTIDKVIKEPWYGDNYSSKIWENKDKLIMELQTNLTQAFIRGDSIDKTTKLIAERMNVAKNRARTLVNTESSYITSKATFDSYSRSGVVKQYEILATLDLHTSKICRAMDGKVFNLSEKEIGLNAPPFHPNCRTTTIAYFPDDIEERIARDSDGNQYYVDGNMTYEDWYNKYVKGNPKEEIAEKKIQNKSSDKKQFEKYKEVLGKEIPDSFDKFQDLKYNNSEEWGNIKNKFGPEFIKKDFKDIPLFHENTSDLLTRKWYNAHDKNIPNLIDTTKSTEEQAKQAHGLRNTYRTQARDLMKDQEKRKQLDIDHPNKSFEKFIQDKINRKHLTKEQAIEDTLKTATKTNKQVNKSLGLE